MAASAGASMKMELLKEEDLDVAARMSARAFADSPVYSYVLAAQPFIGAPADPVDVLFWLFRRNFEMRMSLNACRVGVVDGEVKCFYMLEPPEVMQPLPLSTMLLAGLWQVPFRFGYESTRRLLATIDWFEEMTASVSAKIVTDDGTLIPCCKLERMSVAPGCQGSGIGTTCLRQGLDEAAARGQGVLLATQLQRNVTFYTRLGFEVVEKGEFPIDNGKSIPNWFMVKRP